MSSVRSTVVAVDTGGTFTDVLLVVDGKLVSHKLPSTPDDPGRAVVDGVVAALQKCGENPWPESVLHGTTVGTNALLERSGARVALVVTAGFEDVLRLRRQARPDLYALQVEAPEPLVGPRDSIGVEERLEPDGTVYTELKDEAVEQVLNTLRGMAEEDSPLEAVAVCTLHSYANDGHERLLLNAIQRELPELYSCASSEIMAEFREFERASTTVANAYLAPGTGAYLKRLEEAISHAADADTPRLRIMQSNGGLLSAREAGDYPIRTALSGPAGGVLGGQVSARNAGFSRVVTFDMGGTSSDVGFCAGELATTTDGVVGGVPIQVPMVDLHTVGAGGGSIAWIDSGGALKVGPRSSGAAPGPACYGRGGTQPTVTDANLVLGRMAPDRFLGGAMELDVEAASTAIREHIAVPLDLSLEEAASGIISVVNAAMSRAINVMSVERGHSPGDLALVAFGGAGGMHACDLASQTGIPHVIVPRWPGLLSALGMLHADVVRDVSRTLLLALPGRDSSPDGEAGEVLGQIRCAESELVALSGAKLEADGVLPEQQRFETTADCRFKGQSFELQVRCRGDFAESVKLLRETFLERHKEAYGYVLDKPVELVTLRVRGIGEVDSPDLETLEAGVGAEPAGHLRGWYGGEVECAVYDRASLLAGDSWRGPAVVVEYTATTFTPPGWGGEVDASGALVLSRLQT